MDAKPRYRYHPVLLGLLPLLLLSSACRSDDHPPPPPGAQQAVNWSVVAAGLQDDYLAAAAEAAPASDVRDSNLPLVALEIERIRLRLQAEYRDAAWTAAQEQSQQVAEAALQRLRAGEVALAGQTGAESPGGYLTRAYLARSDGSPQPYFVRLPTGFDADRRWPLVIFLHGYVTDTSKVSPWLLPATQFQMAADRGMILCLPYGRRNSDFVGIGEIDVLRVIEEMERFYPIDPDRVILTGCSMGGYGTWAVGLRNPDRFAGLSLMSGQTDYFTWYHTARDAVKFKSWCLLQTNPLDLAENADHLPLQLQHGEQDPLVPVIHSRLIVPRLQELGNPIEYTEWKGAGHYLYWEEEPFRKMFDWCRDRVRPSPPRELTFRTFTPKQGRSWWVDIRRLAEWGPPAQIEATIDGQALTIRADNVAELWLDLPAELAGDGLSLQINGQPAGRVTAGPHQVLLNDGQPAAAIPGTPPAGRPRVGPAREVFNRPFRVVWATGGDAAQTARNQAAAERFRRLWYGFAEGVVPVVADTELTAEEVAGHNLVVFGEPGTVTLAGLANPAALLPEQLGMSAGAYRVGERTWTGPQYGMVLLTPHPLDAEGLILWWSGQDYGNGLPINHQYDLLPDLLVYNDQVDTDGTNQFEVGGFLDQDWRYDERLLDWATR